MADIIQEVKEGFRKPSSIRDVAVAVGTEYLQVWRIVQTLLAGGEIVNHHTELRGIFATNIFVLKE